MRPRTHNSYSHLAYATTSYDDDVFNETIETCLLVVNLLKKKYDDSPEQNLKLLIRALEKYIQLNQACSLDGCASETFSRLLSVLYAINKNLTDKSNFFPSKVEKLIQQVFMRLDVVEI